MRSIWWSRRAVTLHVALVVAVPLFLTLGAWQWHRALQGNMLSWAYTFEWPFFAGYASWMWWRLVHEETATAADLLPAVARRRLGTLSVDGEADESVVNGAGPTAVGAGPTAIGAGPGDGGVTGEASHRLLTTAGSVPVARGDYDPYDDEADPELAAYNRYLTGLHEQSPKR